MEPFEPLPVPPLLEEPKKKTNTALIVVIVILLVLCCLCLLAAGAGYWLWENGDAIFDLTRLLGSSISV